MNWITTNIRLPEDLYMELKMEAAKKRTSVAAIVREKISKKEKAKKKNVAYVMHELDKLAKENAKYMKDIDTTKIIREMRDEQ